MAQNNKDLIIEIPYGGFGDHLFHSHLPRIAKKSGAYDRVFFSTKSLIRQQDHIDLIWKLNPYVDGLVDIDGVTCNLSELVDNASKLKDCNLLDLVMLQYNLDDGLRWHEPELYYKPKLIPDCQKIIFDPNHFTYIGDFNTSDLYAYLQNNNINFEAVMKLRGNKSLYRYDSKHTVIDAPNVYDLCDVIYSSKEIYCFTSGTATLTTALCKSANVFYGANINRGFHHSKRNKYILIHKTKIHRFNDFVKSIIKKIIKK